MFRKAKKPAKQNLYLLPNIRIKEHFESFIKNLPGSVYCKDTHGTYLACSDYLIYEADLLSTDAVVGKTDYDLFSKEQADILRENDQKVMGDNTFVITEEVVTLPSGEQKFYEVVKAPWKDEQENIIGIIGNSIDITQRKNAEKALKEAKDRAEDANEAKTEFIQNMEHDLRTPSSGVAQMIHLLEEKESDPEKKELLHYVSKASNQLLELINGILEFDKLSQQQTPVMFKKFDFRELVNNVVDIEHPAAISKKLELIFRCSREVPNFVVGDNTRLYRILLNLVSNAVKFTPKGYVKIFTQVAKKISNKKLLIKFVVEDTGIGIPLEKQNVIYERFSRCTPANQGLYSGSGLGLSIVRQLIEDLEGEIEVSSELGKGTVFTCLLPFELSLIDAYDSEFELTNDTKFTGKDATDDFNILLVEDDLLAQKITSSLLTNDCQCRVDLAKTGEDAYIAAQNKQYDLIFMDLGLPDMSGYEVAKKIRSTGNNDVLIIALTAHNAAFAEKSAKEAGMNDFITKPLTLEKASTLLAKWGRGMTQDKKNINKQKKVSREKTKKPTQTTTSHKKAIDLDIGTKIVGGNKTAALDMLKMLTKDLPATKKEITASFKSHDFERLGNIVHKLHGGASYCGVPKLKDAAKKLEIAARQNETKKIDKLYQALIKEIDAVVKEYKKIAAKRAKK